MDKANLQNLEGLTATVKLYRKFWRILYVFAYFAYKRAWVWIPNFNFNVQFNVNLRILQSWYLRTNSVRHLILAFKFYVRH